MRNLEKNFVSVPQGSVATLGKVEGDLHVADGATIKAENSKEVIVSGVVRCEGNSTFECGLTSDSIRGRSGNINVKGALSIERSGRIERGSLIVEGNLSANKIEVDRELSVGKDLSVDTIQVGGKLEVKGDTKAEELVVGGVFEALGNVEGESIVVGGSFRGKGEVKVKGIKVGGAVLIESEVKVEELDVGGKAEVKGGEIRNRVHVGGLFESEGSLTFGLIDVGGKVSLTGTCQGGGIHVGGSLKVEGDLKFTDIDVGGGVEVIGNAEGGTIEVGGRLNVVKKLALTGKLNVEETAEAGETLGADSINVGSLLKARRIEAENSVRVGRQIETVEGVKAALVEIGVKGRIRGVVVAHEALLREGSEAEDIYVDFLTMEERSRARKIYAKSVHLERACRVTGELHYTEDLRMEEDVYFSKEPEKTEKLPSPPF